MAEISAGTALPSCCTLRPAGIRIAIRLQPKASNDKVVGLVTQADKSVMLKVAVRAAPEQGKANEALEALLARLIGVPARDISVVMGQADRRKVVEIAGAPRLLAALIAEKLSPWTKAR